ncbi:MAG: DUF1616 domain-containing protein [Halovenus sp.]
MESRDGPTREQLRRWVTGVLAVALVVALGGVVYVALTPGAAEDPFTEFYILGPDGNASDYPTNLTAGESGELIVGVTNNEQEEMTYTVVLARDGESLTETTGTVGDGETWEERVAFSVDEPGEHRLAILLFVGEDPDSLEDPYQELQLIVEVREE